MKVPESEQPGSEQIVEISEDSGETWTEGKIEDYDTSDHSVWFESNWHYFHEDEDADDLQWRFVEMEF